MVDISVRFENVRRGPNRNVTGTVVLNVRGSIIGQDIDENVASHGFDFPEGGEESVFGQDLSFNLPVVNIEVRLEVSAQVHEHAPGQCCVQGRVNLTWPGGNVGRDLDPNCTPIQES